MTNIPVKAKTAPGAGRASGGTAYANPWLTVPETPVSGKPAGAAGPPAKTVAAPVKPPAPVPVAAPVKPPAPVPVAAPVKPPAPVPGHEPWCDIFEVSPWSVERRPSGESGVAGIEKSVSR